MAFGVPAVALRAALRRPRPDVERPSHVAFVMVNAIGDTILLSGVIGDTKTALPDATISLVVGHQNAAAAALIPGCDTTLVVSPTRPWDAMRRLRELEADVVIDCAPWSRVSALIATAGRGFSIGFSTPAQHRSRAFDGVVKHRSDVHQVDNLRALVRALGVESRSLPRVVSPVVAAPGLPKPYVVFHGEAGGYRSNLREWPLRHWLQLAEATRSAGFHIAVTGVTPDPPVGRVLAEAMDGVSDLTGQLSLAGTAAVLAGARYVVSVNTGVMHLAAALGTPTVGLSGPTNPARWGPVGPRCASVVAERPDCAYLDLGFEHPRKAMDCMGSISVEAVLSGVEELGLGS